jgi:tetratricopeptide (TPR) repeat protein
MIQMLFSLRFQTQLRRTRPNLFKSIENFIEEAVRASGGIPGIERRYIRASFDEKTIGFWIDILTMLESIGKILESADSDLYGYALVLGKELEDVTLRYFHLLTSGEGGIWSDAWVRKALAAYGEFERPGQTSGIMGFVRLKTIHVFSAAENAWEKRTEQRFPYREKILRTLKQGMGGNTLLTGPRFIGKREGIRRYCAQFLGAVPPLTVTFGAGGGGLSCFADALTPPIRALLIPSTAEETMRELNVLGDLIARERFRSQYSEDMFYSASRFLHLLCEAYAAVLRQTRLTPVFVLVNIHEAEAGAVQAFSEWYHAAPAPGFLIYGTFCSDARYARVAAAPSPGGVRHIREPWKGIFPYVVQFPPDDNLTPPAPQLSVDFWEIAYVFFLFRRYFPSAQLPVLLGEAGINPHMAQRTVDFFLHRGIIDFRDDPLPRIMQFIPQAEEILGERKDKVRQAVRERVLAWMDEGKFNPCFNVLRALAELGGQGSDGLILESLMGDIINRTYSAIDDAINTGEFETLLGESCALPLRYIVAANKALLHGTEEDICGAFLAPPPDAGAFPLYKAVIYIGITAYHLSVHDHVSAHKTAKEAMMLSQSLELGKGLVQAYRLFSLVNVSVQSLDDAMEYCSFAIEHAERRGIQDELAIAAYYAAGTNFLSGNISEAERLARRSEAAAVVADRGGWADRARFLRGRLCFETGRYAEALEIFEALADQSPPSSNRGLTCAAWIFRTEVFLDRPAPRVPALMNYDARFFAVEAAYFAGSYREAVLLTDALFTALPESSFFFVEQPDWRSGFSQCELLTSSPRKFFMRLLLTYRALALCRVEGEDPAKSKARRFVLSEAQSEAHDCLRRVLREEGMSPADPNDAFYYYANYCVLQETDAVEVDMNTAVSLAFKRLQSRASRIDDIETKRSFLSRNYWNKALGEAAKHHKLI